MNKKNTLSLSPRQALSLLSLVSNNTLQMRRANTAKRILNELEVRFMEGQQKPTGRKEMIKENYIGANGQECESDAEVDEFENVDEGVFKPIPGSLSELLLESMF